MFPLLTTLYVLALCEASLAYTPGIPVASPETVKNFRPVSDLSRVYRCAKTEPLADVTSPTTEDERILLEQCGLVIDLRSKVERDDDKAAQWMPRFGFRPVDAVRGDDVPLPHPTEKRVMRIDVQSRAKINDYLTENWMTPQERVASAALENVDADRLFDMRRNVINGRGLAGLNEAILETAGEDLNLALREITKHLETCASSVVFHCAQGKDRTGVLAMLCQAILGDSDEQIVAEYALSECMRDPSSAAAKMVMGRKDRRLDTKIFAGAPREQMVKTLDYTNQKYGSVSPNYLDSIGFDSSWRERFIACQQ